jgi:hypothetical protein
MTLNWGHKLVLVFIVFAGMMLFLAYKCVQTNFDLVSKEYYKDELVYQQVIDGSNRANNLSEKVLLVQQEKNIILSLPGEMKGLKTSGNILFYYPADAHRDRKIELTVSTDATQVIPTKDFMPGNYTAKISWTANDKFYYSEQPVSIH